MPTYPQDPIALTSGSATGYTLDSYARLVGVERRSSLEGEETDADLRQRIVETLRDRALEEYRSLGLISGNYIVRREPEPFLSAHIMQEWQSVLSPPPERPRTTCWQYILAEDAA